MQEIKSYQNFPSYSALSNLQLFVGEVDLQQTIELYIQTKLIEARKEGYQQAKSDFRNEMEKIAGEARAEIDSYITLVTRVADYIYEKSKANFAQELEIEQTRTNFYFGAKRIKILFIIKGSFEKELEFSNLLNEVEKEVFENDNFICELLYINKTGIELNEDSIDYDFPLTRTRKEKNKVHS